MSQLCCCCYLLSLSTPPMTSMTGVGAGDQVPPGVTTLADQDLPLVMQNGLDQPSDLNKKTLYTNIPAQQLCPNFLRIGFNMKGFILGQPAATTDDKIFNCLDLPVFTAIPCIAL